MSESTGIKPDTGGFIINKNKMKTINFGFALDGGCPKNSMAVIEPLPRIGINNLVLYNIFQKNYNVTSFVAQLKKIINGPHGKINVMLTLDSAPFSEMNDAKKYSLPTKYRSACNWINRFPPDNIITFSNVINNLISSIQSAGLMPYISWQLWQEYNSPKYYHGTLAEFNEWTNFKIGILKPFGRPIYFGSTSASLVTDYTVNNHRNWHDAIADYGDLTFSTSFYWLNSAGEFDPNKNTFPNKEAVITGYNFGGTESEMNSSLWIIKFVEFLKWIYDKEIDTVYFWNLLDCNNHDNKGKYSAWSKTENGYTAKPLWAMITQLCNVLQHPDGVMRYTLTASGIKGFESEI